jgi:hypothetical protein
LAWIATEHFQATSYRTYIATWQNRNWYGLMWLPIFLTVYAEPVAGVNILVSIGSC